MGHSDICRDPTTRWRIEVGECVPCPKSPGHKTTTNCGYGDDGARHEVTFLPCQSNTFNDGSRYDCQPCSPCQSGERVVSKCTPTNNTKCEKPRSRTTEGPAPKPTTSASVFSNIPTTKEGSSLANKATPHQEPPTSPWVVPLVSLLSITAIIVLISAVMIYRKRKRGQHTEPSCCRRSSLTSPGFSSLYTSADNELESILSPNILSAPLQTVLDNLDVLEELVILLDPESRGIKNTKHLASHCSFPSTWITYTYSMKDSKSPLKAVLEGVTSRHPDWTVEHLAKLLKLIERNDAIFVLSKLRMNVQ
uniref:TNFR-Cys domain-containing protein n=1 Tax=Monopterus albus TaxID=43700 RepID=A0A3Q3IBN7_MONAL|nr:IGF-like family receptor 1 [Monopterus albus]